MLAIGVLSSWVTALRKESWRSLGRISRMRKTVLRTTPAMRAAKRTMPRMAKATVRWLRRIQALWVMVRPTRIAPRVMKKAMAPRRRVMFMLVKSVYLVEQLLASCDATRCDVADGAAHDAS